MRIPEQCPFCGAAPFEDVTEEQGGVLRTCACGVSFWHIAQYGVTTMWSDNCIRVDTPDAKAYRQRLLWRKRLSQHTGVPLRRCPEPDAIYSLGAWWGALGVGRPFWSNRTCVLEHKGGFEFERFPGEAGRDEARRRLLAREVGNVPTNI